jgi:hypothetical protein
MAGGSLTTPQSEPFARTVRKMLAALAVLGTLTACAPQARVACELCRQLRGEGVAYSQYFFSADAWGGLPFSQQEMRETLVEAVGDASRRRLERAVPFRAVPDAWLSFIALYEVDASEPFPRIRSGYLLEVPLTDGRPSQIALTNEDTGVTRTVLLARDAR